MIGGKRFGVSYKHALFFVLNHSLVHRALQKNKVFFRNVEGDEWEMLMVKGSQIDQEARITVKLDSGGVHITSWMGEQMNNWAARMEIYTWRTTETCGGKKTTRVDMRRRHTLEEGVGVEEKEQLPASENTVILHLNAHCITWQTTSERGGRREALHREH